MCASFDCLPDRPKPNIAALNGAATGAGCVTALCCDIIRTSDKGFLQRTEVHVGLAGGVAHVRRHPGESDARMMIHAARRVYGPELLRMSVASACAATEDLMDAARAVAVFVARAGPSAVRAAKKAFQLTEGVSIHDGHRFGRSLTKALATSEDAAEATGAFREKRAPSFKG